MSKNGQRGRLVLEPLLGLCHLDQVVGIEVVQHLLDDALPFYTGERLNRQMGCAHAALGKRPHDLIPPTHQNLTRLQAGRVGCRLGKRTAAVDAKLGRVAVISSACGALNHGVLPRGRMALRRDLKRQLNQLLLIKVYNCAPGPRVVDHLRASNAQAEDARLDLRAARRGHHQLSALTAEVQPAIGPEELRKQPMRMLAGRVEIGQAQADVKSGAGDVEATDGFTDPSVLAAAETGIGARGQDAQRP